MTERKLNAASLQKIDEIVAKHQGKPGPVKLMLHDVQRELGYIPFEAIEKIAEGSGVSPAEVYGVVTFYTQFLTEPKGKHIINVCLGTACYVKGSQKLIDRAVELTGAGINKTSPDGMFSIDATRCLGACGLAPVCVIDGKTIGSCTPAKVSEIIAEIKKAEEAAA